MTTPHNDPFDLDDRRPRQPTNLDRWIADGVREAERKREWEKRQAKGKDVAA